MHHDVTGFGAGRPTEPPAQSGYFAGATQRKALSCLGLGLSRGDGIVVVTGPEGSGKSAFAAHLMATIDRERLTAGLIDGRSATDLAVAAARAFGLAAAGDDRAAALAASEKFLQAEACAGRRCLLVIDDADALAPAALGDVVRLAELQLGGHALLQVLLLAGEGFRAGLGAATELAAVQARVVAAHRLGGLAPDEVGPYLACRLGSGAQALAADVIAAIAEASGGNPGEVERMASEMLADGWGDEGPPVPTPWEQTLAELRLAAADRFDPAAHEPGQPCCRAAGGEELAEAARRIAALEARTLAQEHALRQMMGLLIEWIEHAGPNPALA